MEENQEELKDTAPPAGPKYFVHNLCRSRHNRVARAQAATHRGMKQHIGDGQHRLIRGRPVPLSEEKFQQYLPELKMKASMHLLEVRTADGRKVDLDSLEVQPGLPAAPLPNFPLDSAANDKNKGVGEIIPPYVGDDQNSMPAVLPEGQLPQVLAKKAQEEKAAAEAAAAAEGDDGEVDPLDDADAAAIEKAIAEAGDAPSDTEVVSSESKGRKSK